MDPRTQDREASPRSRWGAALALAGAIAVYLGLQGHAVAAAVRRALEAWHG